jgi:hypothetical protein
MASKSEHKPNNTEHSPKSKEIDYAVQPVDMGSTVPVDGPIEEMNDVSEARATPSGPDGCASDPDTSSVSEQQPLDSHFSSPKSSTQDGMSDTTLEDGEVREHILKDSSVSKIACTGDENEADKVEDVEPNANSISLKLAHRTWMICSPGVYNGISLTMRQRPTLPHQYRSRQLGAMPKPSQDQETPRRLQTRVTLPMLQLTSL